jgi:hypothetical protein
MLNEWKHSSLWVIHQPALGPRGGWVGASWPRGQCVRRAIAEAKQRWAVI